MGQLQKLLKKIDWKANAAAIYKNRRGIATIALLVLIFVCLSSAFRFMYSQTAGEEKSSMPYAYITVSVAGGTNATLSPEWLAAKVFEVNPSPTIFTQTGLPLRLFDGVSMEQATAITIDHYSECIGPAEIWVVLTNETVSDADAHSTPFVSLSVSNLAGNQDFATYTSETTKLNVFYLQVVHITIPPEGRQSINAVTLSPAVTGNYLWGVTVRHECPPRPEDMKGGLAMNLPPNGAHDLAPVFAALNVERAVPGQWRYIAEDWFWITDYDIGAGSTISIPPGTGNLNILVTWQGNMTPNVTALDLSGQPMAIGNTRLLASTSDSRQIGVVSLQNIEDGSFVWDRPVTVLGITLR